MALGTFGSGLFNTYGPAGSSHNTISSGTTGPAPGSSTQQNTAQNHSWQSFQNPDLVAALSNSIGNAAGNSGMSFSDFINDPASSPLFQNQLSALLQSLVPSENLARQGLTDQFRAAGGLRSGAYGNAGAALEGNILGNRQTEAGKLLGQSFPQIVQALLGSMGQGNALINELKMNETTGSSQGTQSSQNYPPQQTQGGASGGGGGGLSSLSGGFMAPPGGGVGGHRVSPNSNFSGPSGSWVAPYGGNDYGIGTDYGYGTDYTDPFAGDFSGGSSSYDNLFGQEGFSWGDI